MPLVDPSMRWAAGHAVAVPPEVLPMPTEGVGVVVQDRDGRIMGANADACRLLGLSWEQMQGLTSIDPRWKALDGNGLPLPGDQHPAMVTLATGRALTDVVMGVVAPAAGSGDSTTWITVRTTPLVDAAGDRRGVVSTFVDASTTEHGREAMNRIVTAYRTVAENASDVVVRTSPAAVIEWVSPSVTTVLGWAPGELVGTTLSGLIHPDDRATYLATSRRLNAGETVHYRCRFQCADGSYRWIDSVSRPIHDADGRVVARVGGFRDVQAEVEAETARRELEERYRLIVENATDMVVVVAADRHITWAAPTVAATLGWDPEDLIGVPMVSLIHPEDRAESEEVRHRLYDRNARETEHRLGRMLTKDGGYRWMEVRATPQLAESGDVRSIVVALRDVDDLVRARESAQLERSNLRSTLDALLDPHVVMRPIRDASGQVVDFEYTDANPAACEYNGMRREDLVGARLLDLLPGHGPSGLLASYATVLATGEPLALDDFRYPNEIQAEERYYDIRAVRVADSLSYTWRDVTARHVTEQRIAESERRFRLLADNAMDMIFTVSLDGVVEWCSPSVSTVLGHHPEDLVGRLSMVILLPEDRGLARRMAAQADRGGTPTYRARFVTATGDPKWMEVSPRALRDESGRLLGRVVAVRDVDSEVTVTRALEYEIDFDSLTGLAKRELVLRRVRAAIDARTTEPWALMCLGVLGLTAINQAYGYSAGDQVLRAVAERLVRATGRQERVARVSGDEFVILMCETATETDAAQAAEALLAEVEAPVEVGVDGVLVEIQACIGVSMWQGTDAEPLLQDATAAMRKAARKGTRRWEILERSVAEESRHALDVRAGLRQALADGRIQPWFMPVVDLASGDVRGFESLVRWVLPDGTVVPPDDFLPIAEQSDLIVRIDHVMLARTLDVLATLDDGLHAAVNVSAATLSAGSLEAMVRAELDRTGVAPSRLHIEVTETDLIHLTDEIDSVMRSLGELGVLWWIDDFGTGYSSISHLRDMHVQGLKLDRSFTAGLASGDDRAVRLAQGLAGLAEGLGLMTIAEGVETREQAEILQVQGWQMGQGWLYGKPAPVSP